MPGERYIGTVADEALLVRVAQADQMFGKMRSLLPPS
jgi:hypothetical protein